MAPPPRKGKAFSTPYEVPETGRIAPFDLFCACLLGLMPDGTYRSAGLGEVAKRLRRSPNELRDLLQSYGMDHESLRAVDFDLELAKLDIQVAPEGIDRRELARGLFEEFVDVHPTLGDLEPAAVQGNGTGATAGPAPAAVEHPHRRKAPASPPKAAPRPEPQAQAPEPEAEGGEEAAEAEPEPSLVTADVTADVAGGRPEAASEEGAPHAERPVRQIRRSPVRRGRGG